MGKEDDQPGKDEENRGNPGNDVKDSGGHNVVQDNRDEQDNRRKGQGLSRYGLRTQATEALGRVAALCQGIQ